MRDWKRYISERLDLPRVDAARARDIERELAGTLEEMYREALARGLSEEEADRRARAHIPDFQALAGEIQRAERGRRRPASDRWIRAAGEAILRRGPRWAWAADLVQDLRYALRSLRSSPAFTAVSLLTLALGIGGVTTIFTLFDHVILRPLPYPESHRLVLMWEKLASFDNAMVSYPNFQDWRARNRVYEDVAVWNSGSMTLTGSGDPMEVDAVNVSASAFPVLGVEPAQGRGFTEEEDAVEGPPVVILAHGFWQRQMGGDPEAVGRTITLDDTPFTVVGILAPDLRFPPGDEPADLYLPVGQFAEGWVDNRGSHPGLMALARLRPGVSLDMAAQDMERIALELEAEYPETNTGSRIHVAPMKDRVVRNARDPIVLLLLAVGFLLLIACMNVANLVLARTTGRQQEMAVRASLGAGRSRILRLLLADSLLLWVLGGLLGILAASFGVGAITSLLAEEIPQVFQIGLDFRVASVALGVTLLTGVVFGLPAGLKVLRQQPREVLKEGRRSSGGADRRRFRSALVVGEVTLAVALLAGAGLALRSFQEMTETSAGLEAANVLTAEVNLPGSRYEDPQDRLAFFSHLLERVRGLPGVESAATTYVIPMAPGGWQNAYHVEGTPPEAGGQYTFAEVSSISDEYFATMGIPLRRGRDFRWEDDADASPVVIVDEEMAREAWPGEDPLGKRLKWGGFDSENEWMEVVGVAGRVMVNGVQNETLHQLYIPHGQDNDDGYWLVVKTRGDPLALAGILQRQVLDLDPALALGTVATMGRWVAATTRSTRLLALLLALFSGTAVLLAAVGTYGVMAQLTAERRHEIGIRVALGARGNQVMGLVFRQGLATVGIGVGLGMFLALLLGRLMASQLFGVSPADPVTFATVPLLVAGVALLANLIPARRAMEMDPVKSLQAD